MALPVAQTETVTPQPALVPRRGRPRSRRRVLRTTAIVFLLLVLGAVAFAVWFVRRPWPEVSGRFTTLGLHSRVEVLRDRWGTPHIYANDIHDLFFAQG